MSQVKMSNKEGVAIINIRRPEQLNALSKDVVDEIDAIISKIVRDGSTRVVIFYSEENFAAGADIRGMAESSEEKAREVLFTETFNKVADLEIPTIAAMEGYALGGGLELALACDFRIVSEGTKIGFPEIKLGIMPGAGGTIRTPRLTSISKAMELILLGEIITGQEALQIGLVNKVVAKNETLDIARIWASKLANGPTVAINTAKKTIKMGLEYQNLHEAIEMESRNWTSLFSTEDQKEGMKAFTEKRKPVFKGK